MFKDVFTVHGEFEFHSCAVNLEMAVKHLKFVCMHQKKIYSQMQVKHFHLSPLFLICN